MLGVDVDPDEVARLSAGELPFYAPGLDELPSKTLATVRLVFIYSLHEVDVINGRRRRTVDLVRDLAGGSIDGVRVCALGAAFKPNSDDISDAPALDVARMLQEEGAVVSVYDPEAMDNARRAYPDLHYADGVGAAARDADVVVLLTEWQQFRAIDPELLGHIVARRCVVDGRHALPAETWRAAGWDYGPSVGGERARAAILDGRGRPGPLPPPPKALP